MHDSEKNGNRYDRETELERHTKIDIGELCSFALKCIRGQYEVLHPYLLRLSVSLTLPPSPPFYPLHVQSFFSPLVHTLSHPKVKLSHIQTFYVLLLTFFFCFIRRVTFCIRQYYQPVSPPPTRHLT